MNQFSGMSTGTTLGKGLEELYQNKDYLEDIDRIKDFVAKNTGFRIEHVTANPKHAIIKLRAKDA